MHDILSLHPAGFGPEDADRFYAKPHVRAVAHTRFGSGTGGIVMSRVESFTSTTTSTGKTSLCEPPSICAVIEPILPSKTPMTLPPLDRIVLALVSVAGGVQRGYHSHLAAFEDAPDGVLDARAVVLGMEDVHFLLEVVGDDPIAVTRRFMALTDHSDVVGVRSFVVPKEHTRGFGVPLEDKAGAQRPRARVASKVTTRAKR